MVSLESSRLQNVFDSPLNDAERRSLEYGHVKIVKSAFRTRICKLSYENTNKECLLPEVFLKEVLDQMQYEVISFLKSNYALKFNIELHAVYTQPDMQDFENTPFEVKIFKTEMQEIFDINVFNKEFLNQIEYIIRRTEDFKTYKSGWTLLQLEKVEINLNKYQPLRGSGYLPLPRNVLMKKACVNVKNKDEYCFKWAILSAVVETNRNSSTTSYKVKIDSEIIATHNYVFNFKGLSFPLKVTDVSIFEENNSTISVNVFGYNNQSDLVIGPYYKTKTKKPKHVNLLYIEDTIDGRTVGHYIWIKSFSRLIHSQLTGNSVKVFVCDSCLQHFQYDGDLRKHIANNCQKEEKVLEEDKCVIKYQNYIKVIDVPFVFYANSERVFQNTKTHNPMPYAFSYFIKCSYDNALNTFRCFKGMNSPRLFLESIINNAKRFYDCYSTKMKLKSRMTEEENLKYERTNVCCICSKVINPQEFKARLRCRITGKFKGPAHLTCSSRKIPKKFPVIFYNLSINDSVLLIRELNDMDDNPVNVIPLNNESHITFVKYIDIGEKRGKLEIHFLSFINFMPFNLDSIIKNMSEADFKILKSIYPENDKKFGLILKKLVFPYNYLMSANQFAETCLPSKAFFYNQSTDEECSLDDYSHAKNVWSEFQCETLGDYLTLCLKANVLKLAEIFESFRSICKDVYNLDPCHYINTANYSWDAMLKTTDIKLRLLNDKSMNAFIQKGMRGGISTCFQTHSFANNKYLSDYNDNFDSKYIVYFHANNLYSKVMSEPLPVGNFEWEVDIEHFSLDSIPNDSKIGYILEVDLEYPQEIHDIHRTLPFCSQNVQDKQKEANLGFNDKKNYIIYYKNLQQCLKHGLKLQKIHRILKFNQTDWLKNYISLNNNRRDNAKNTLEMAVLKLMNNALYDKIMENVAKKYKILKKWENEGKKLEARSHIVKTEFSSVHIFDENLVAIELNIDPYRYMPIYLEFMMSELVKLKMYDFHYEYVIPKYTTNVQLNYIDNDSFIYTILTDDFYKDIANDIYQIFNKPASDVDNNSRLRLKTLGMMKDANCGVVIKEFIGIRPKLYSLKTEYNSETNKTNNATQNHFCSYNNLLEYKNCDDINLFKLKLHQMYASLVDNIALSYLNNRDYKEEVEDHVMHVE